MRKSGLVWLWITVMVLLLDRCTKYLVQDYLIAYAPVKIFPGFNLTLSFNTGSAFGFLNNPTSWQGWMFGGIAIVVSIGILIWLSRLSWRQYGLSIALSLVMGGALGNLWDRISQGRVVDFLQFYVGHLYWPTFNVADSAICIGAVILLMHMLFHKK